MRVPPYLNRLFLILLKANSTFKSKIFYSQACQDAFVYTLLYDIEKKSDKGYYLEIGAAHPIRISNTYFLEKNLDWKGVSIEISPHYQKLWARKRRNQLLLVDATQTDYSIILKPFPKIIDYLSVDVDGQYDVVLNKIPFDKYIFKIITIEHDFYRFGAIYKDKERQILTSLGYQLLCSDVLAMGQGSFEDWWVHPSGFAKEKLQELLSLDLKEKDPNEIISILIHRFNSETDSLI